jgi:hypothetical protein
MFLLAPLWVLFLILRGTLINQAGGGRTTAMVKATVTEARFTNLISNGGSFGGDIHVVGDHYIHGDNLYLAGSGAIRPSTNVGLYCDKLYFHGSFEFRPDTAIGMYGDLYMNGHTIHP